MIDFSNIKNYLSEYCNYANVCNWHAFKTQTDEMVP
jgi:uncharacterized protein YutD